MSSPIRAIDTAVRAHQGGDLRLAERLYGEILESEPENPDALHLLGLVAQQTGRIEEAERQIARAIRLKPRDGVYRANFAATLQALGRIEEAILSYQESIRLNPKYATAYVGLAGALIRRGRFKRAIVNLRKAIALNPSLARAHHLLGTAWRELGRLDHAETSLLEAIRLKPGVCEVHNDLGVVFWKREQFPQAESRFREAIRLKADFTEAWNNLGAVLRDSGNLAAAREALEQALRAKPDAVDALNNLATVLQLSGEPRAALRLYDRVLELDAGHVWGHFNRANVQLLLGDFSDGLREYEWRFRRPNAAPRRYDAAAWDGDSLAARRILLYAEQGLGDTIQFVRFAPLVKRQGARVIVECPARLIPLLSRCGGVDQWVARGARLPEFDLHLPLLSVPRLLQQSLDTVPRDVPYVYANPRLIELWRRSLDSVGGFRVGINWQGNPLYARDRFRSVALRHFEPLARVPGVQLISLHKGTGREQLAALRERWPIVDLGDELDEATGAFMDTAAIMMNLDLVITTDTAIPHLAGALGIPVWMATPYAPDWRWLLERDDSPWYPTMRLFREHRLGDWDGVFQRMARALAEFVARRADSSSFRVSEARS